MNEKNLLLQLFSAEPRATLEDITETQWSSILELAGKQHVAACLYHHLQETGTLGMIPEDAKEALFQAFQANTFRNMALIAEFRRITEAFSKQEIPVIGLKGLHLAEKIYPHIGLRYLRDLDVLVPAEQMESAYRATLALGYQCEKVITKQDLVAPHHHHLHQQYHPDKAIILELHGYLIEDKNIEMRELWENASPFEGHHYRYLDSEDLLLHLCMHISYSDLFKIDLRHYLDIYMMLKNQSEKINWEAFLVRAEKRGLTKGVLLVMQITSELFACKLPEQLQRIVKDDPGQRERINHAVDFMWQYDKSSKGYNAYKSRVFVPDEPILRRLVKRIFIPKEELSFYYSLDPDSWRVYPYYGRRVYDLFQRHFFMLIRTRTDSRQIEAVDKTRILHRYLFGN
ncbi:MAG: nucleotidyltransferase family protein [Sulfurovum sp.]|nr:nucleotidyltransferase family protein [Sulfurovum sp.]MDD3499979.1 nucleotidyltransferase family protein [Sulfurovum sp.]